MVPQDFIIFVKKIYSPSGGTSQYKNSYVFTGIKFVFNVESIVCFFFFFSFSSSFSFLKKDYFFFYTLTICYFVDLKLKILTIFNFGSKVKRFKFLRFNIVTLLLEYT